MSVYYDNLIYGIGWNIYNNDKIITKYEKHYNEKMTMEQIRKVEEEYNKLTNSEKKDIKFFIVTNNIVTNKMKDSNVFVRYYLNKNRIEEIFKFNKFNSLRREGSQRSNSLSEKEKLFI